MNAIAIKHFVVKKIQKVSVYHCTMDNWITMHKLKILRQQSQILLKEKDKIYKCEICEKEFKNNDDLKKHFNVVHNNLVKEHHQCNICQKVFRHHGKLTSHMKIAHENQKQHKCASCEMSFFTCITFVIFLAFMDSLIVGL